MVPPPSSSRHTDFSALPIIDVSALLQDNVARKAPAVKALGRAAREAGFFYITGHGIAPALIARLNAQAQSFFARPLAEKMALYIGNSGLRHRGYVPVGEEVLYGGGRDNKEAFDLCLDLPETDPDYLAGQPLTGPNVWPDLPGFKEDVGAYYRALLALGRRLFQGFALSLGLAEDFFTLHVTKPPSQLRLIHYPFSPETPSAGPGIGAHTDYECFTILLPTAPGLEVMNGAGAWIDAPPLPDAFVVNIGDMMEIWTNGAYVATSHRVRRVAEERYAFPLFFACDYRTVVEPLAPFAGPDRPARYAPLVAGEHLFAQTAQSFRYLRARLENGTLRLPECARPLSSFGRDAKVVPQEGQVR